LICFAHVTFANKIFTVVKDSNASISTFQIYQCLFIELCGIHNIYNILFLIVSVMVMVNF
jgi:hypothetical protein